MTLREAIDKADALKPNQFTDDQKVDWLSQLDSNIYTDLLMSHEPVPTKDFTPYTVETMDDELIAPFPYDELYVAYLKMKTDEMNEDTARYNNSAAFFNSHLDNYSKHVNKTQMPVNKYRLHTW